MALSRLPFHTSARVTPLGVTQLKVAETGFPRGQKIWMMEWVFCGVKESLYMHRLLNFTSLRVAVKMSLPRLPIEGDRIE